MPEMKRIFLLLALLLKCVFFLNHVLAVEDTLFASMYPGNSEEMLQIYKEMQQKICKEAGASLVSSSPSSSRSKSSRGSLSTRRGSDHTETTAHIHLPSKSQLEKEDTQKLSEAYDSCVFIILPMTTSSELVDGAPRKHQNPDNDKGRAALFEQPDFLSDPNSQCLKSLSISQMAQSWPHTFRAFLRRCALEMVTENDLSRVLHLIEILFAASNKAEYADCLADLFRSHCREFQTHALGFLDAIFMHWPQLLCNFVTNANIDLSALSFAFISAIFWRKSLPDDAAERFKSYVLLLPHLNLNCYDDANNKEPLLYVLLCSLNRMTRKEEACVPEQLRRLRYDLLIAVAKDYRLNVDVTFSNSSQKACTYPALLLAAEAGEFEIARLLSENPEIASFRRPFYLGCISVLELVAKIGSSLPMILEYAMILLLVFYIVTGIEP